MGDDYYLYLNQGERQYFSLPTAWLPIHFVNAEEDIPTSSIERMTLEAFSRPTGTRPFQDLLSGVRRVAIIVDDRTRPTPVAEILGVLLTCLKDGGISLRNISIVVALGTHDAMDRDALESRLGTGVISSYNVVQHNALQNDLVPIPIPGQDRSVKINPEVALADLKVGVSSILPHPMAGYGGGFKIIMPGICDFETIRGHHIKYIIHPQSKIGITKGNPFHEGCLNVARAVGLDFAVNCVYNRKGQVIRIIGGDLEMAFEEAVEVCLEKLGHRFEEKVDVTITSTYPHTYGQQIFKGLSAPDIVTKDTGAILLVAPFREPIPQEFLESFRMIKEKSRNNSVGYVKDALSKGMAFLPGKSIDFNMAMSAVFLRPRIRTILVSPTISREEVNIMGFEYASSIAEGLMLLEKYYPGARVAIFPSGGLIVPITSWEQ